MRVYAPRERALTASIHAGDDEQLCIFGPLAARRGAELKTMSAVEHKHPGYCVSSKGELRDVDRVPGDEDEGGWGIACVSVPNHASTPSTRVVSVRRGRGWSLFRFRGHSMLLRAGHRAFDR